MSVAFTVNPRQQRYWPKLAEANLHPVVEQAVRQLFNGLYDTQDAFTALASQATLHATVNNGAVTSVDVIHAGKYQNIPTVTAVGGGGQGVRLSATLDSNGGIRTVVVNAGGTGFTSPPYITVTEKT
jgi:NAD kinase